MEKYNFEKYNFDRNIIFCGPPGVGKTFKAKELLNQYKGKGDFRALYKYEISDAKFKQLIKSGLLSLRKPDEYQTSLIYYPLEMMLRVELLLFDDLGTSDITDAYLRDLTFVIDERNKKGLSTIYTTNLKKSELSQKLNERIVSRILYNCDVIVFDGEDRRLQTTQYYKY